MNDEQRIAHDVYFDYSMKLFDGFINLQYIPISQNQRAPQRLMLYILPSAVLNPSAPIPFLLKFTSCSLLLLSFCSVSQLLQIERGLNNENQHLDFRNNAFRRVESIKRLPHGTSYTCSIIRM